MLQCGLFRSNFAFDIAAASYSNEETNLVKALGKTLERVMGIEPT
jgi:hypothetical protein